MIRLLGIDLGTSAVKAVVVDDAGRVLGHGTAEIPIETPAPGWAEQRIEDWETATQRAVHQALEAAGAGAIDGIGLSGQMHGTVLLDRARRPLGPAIIWPDQRSASVLSTMVDRTGRDHLVSVTGTLPAAGFMGPTLFWLHHNAPDLLAKSEAAVFPKDALRLALVPELATDPTDASGSGLFDIRRRMWAGEIIAALGLVDVNLPPVQSSSAVAGMLERAAARRLGLTPGIPVAVGCADQVAQAIGGGLLDPGVASLTLGTGGQLFIPIESPKVDPAGRLHTFCHAAVDRWYLLGATLAAGLSLRWLRQILGGRYDELLDAARHVAPGAEGLTFLPYLVGERSPIMDPAARGGFFGLELRHGRGHLVRAVLEGVAYSLRATVEAAEEVAARFELLIAAGKGLSSPTWRQILADVLGRPLVYRNTTEQTATGAAFVGGVAAGVFRTLNQVGSRGLAGAATTDPRPQNISIYDELYQEYRHWVSSRPRARRPATPVAFH
jgi:xylulokinase